MSERIQTIKLKKICQRLKIMNLNCRIFRKPNWLIAAIMMKSNMVRTE